MKHISWTFIALCSFTTYVSAHNIGASVFSGAMVCYRAYSTNGLTPAQIALLVGLCSLTFGLGVLLLGGLVLVTDPWQFRRLAGMLPRLLTEPTTARLIGVICLSIIYFALPQQGNPGYFVMLGVFMASFSAVLVSEAPGGLGVFELLFIKAMPAVAQHKVLTALLVFRLFYFVLPLVFATIVVVAFERGKLQEALSHTKAAAADKSAKSATQREKSKREPSPVHVS